MLRLPLSAINELLNEANGELCIVQLSDSYFSGNYPESRTNKTCFFSLCIFKDIKEYSQIYCALIDIYKLKIIGTRCFPHDEIPKHINLSMYGKVQFIYPSGFSEFITLDVLKPIHKKALNQIDKKLIKRYENYIETLISNYSLLSYLGNIKDIRHSGIKEIDINSVSKMYIKTLKFIRELEKDYLLYSA